LISCKIAVQQEESSNSYATRIVKEIFKCTNSL